MADEVNFSLLPAELQPLAPLISRYAESDDVERSDLLENASDDDLRELAEAPSAHWTRSTPSSTRTLRRSRGRGRMLRWRLTASPKRRWKRATS